MTDMSGIIQQVAIGALPILVAITFHEVAHGWVADKLGDPTARALGRITLNPFAHIDPIGTVLLPLFLYVTTGFVFGWARPVPVNFNNLRRPKADMAIVAGAGPATNLALAVVCGLVFKGILAVRPDLLPAAVGIGQAPALFEGGEPASAVLIPVLLMLKASVIVNAILLVINLIPIPPVDGGRIAVGLLPPGPAETLARIEPYGIFVLIGIIYLDRSIGILGTAVHVVVWAILG
ncbi:MAG: site-2 protease family protein [Nitrospirae bacterium]|nr:site-2 protease family protein [Nitrospirota bacterium]MBI3393639.1 site-2 protease family protein [Nitrospirota bacterium]